MLPLCGRHAIDVQVARRVINTPQGAVRPREISHARARRAVIAAIRAGRTCYTTLTSAISKHRTVVDRNRHRARKSKSPSSFSHATPRDTVTRTAEAVITMANNPA